MEPKKEIKDEAGIHKDREAQPDPQQKTPTRSAPSSGEDRDQSAGVPAPASAPSE